MTTVQRFITDKNLQCIHYAEHLFTSEQMKNTSANLSKICIHLTTWFIVHPHQKERNSSLATGKLQNVTPNEILTNNCHATYVCCDLYRRTVVSLGPCHAWNGPEPWDWGVLKWDEHLIVVIGESVKAIRILTLTIICKLVWSHKSWVLIIVLLLQNCLII